MEIVNHLLQTAIAFVATFVYARILGKTQLGQLSFYDYVNGITLGSIAAVIATEDTDKMWGGFASLTLFAGLTYLMAYVTIKSRPLRKIIEGSPTIVIRKGKIVEQNMAGMRYDLSELMAQLREKEIFDIADVDYAILETDGQLSVMKCVQAQNITQQDLNITPQSQQMTIDLIMDGEVIAENLKQAHQSQSWLEDQLRQQGVTDIRDVIYACVDTQGKLYINKRSNY